MLFDKKVVLFDKNPSTKTEALTELADELYRVGAVTKEYAPAILKRESSFPTGLMALFQNQEAMNTLQSITSIDEFILVMERNGIINLD